MKKVFYFFLLGMISTWANAQTTDSLKSQHEVRRSGFTNITKAGLLTLSSFSIGTVTGYQYKERLMLGAGIGLDVYNNSGTYPYNYYKALYYLPISLELRFFGDRAGKNKIFFPLGFINAGPSFILETIKGGKTSSPNYNGHIYSNYPPEISPVSSWFSVGIGAGFSLRKNLCIILEMGMKGQNINYIYHGELLNFVQVNGSSYVQRTQYSEKRQTSVLNLFFNIGVKF